MSNQDKFQQYEEALGQAGEVISKLEDRVEELSQAPWQVVVALQVNNETNMVRFMARGTTVEANIPTALHGKIQPGYELKLNQETGAIVNAVPIEILSGTRTMISSVHEDTGTVEVDIGGNPTMVQAPSNMKFEVGDRVVINSNSIVMNMGKKDSRFAFDGTTNVSWDDIGGLEDAKLAMREAIELPIARPELFKKYGKQTPKGIVLYGPPGTGKTMLGKAAATAIAQLHGHEGSAGFIYVKGPEIFNAYVGQSEANVRGLFNMARQHQKEAGYPAVLFLDEADALLRKRNGSGMSAGSTVHDSVVNQFLAEMDGLESSGAIVIIATNRLDIIDNAILRDGRVDRKIKVDRPRQKSGSEIAGIHLRGRPLAEELSHDEARDHVASAMYNDSHILYDVTMMDGASANYTLGDRIDGAMIAAAIEHAATFAMRRDLKGGSFTGINRTDLDEGVALVYNQTMQIDNEAEASEFLSSIPGKIKSASKRVM